jgi:uncharacterized protein involved in exopolysaccharide biosynthesis
MPRYFCVEVERTVTYRRKVWAEVEEADEGLNVREALSGLARMKPEMRLLRKPKQTASQDEAGSLEYMLPKLRARRISTLSYGPSTTTRCRYGAVARR